MYDDVAPTTAASGSGSGEGQQGSSLHPTSSDVVMRQPDVPPCTLYSISTTLGILQDFRC